jgi:phosphotransferase system HPr-like phosphotransfer protein
MKIRLNNSADATEIVSVANKFKDCDIDAQFGRYVIDLKSILGVLSFGLPKDIDINIVGPEKDIETFSKTIEKWRV